MNINLAYPFSLLALFVSSAMADQVADSRISDVTVYPDSANITRTIEVVLPAGSETILIPGLPASIDENSLRIKGTTGKKTQVVSLDLKKETRADWVLPQVSELQKKLEQQQDALAILMANDQALTIQQQYLQKIAEQGGGEKANAGSADWQKNMQVLGDGMKNTGAARVALSREIKIRKNEIAATKRALDAINNQQKDTRTALIHLQSDGGKAQLMLSYQLSDARWSPVYDANLDTKSSKLQVTQAAYIQQNTGENWDQVALTLSTLRPNSSSVPPRLYSWWIDYHDIRPVARNTLLKSAERMADAAPEMMAMAPVEEQQAVVLNTGYQVAYQIPGRVSVSSSQEKQRVVIDQQQWPAEMTLKAVPKQDPHAYLFAQLENPSSTPLLPGEWRWQRDGVNVGKSQQPLFSPKEKMEFGFGVDDNVALNWSIVKDERHEEGVLNKLQTLQRKYQLKVTNGHVHAMALSVLDNWPVSKQEDIKVSVLEGTTAPTEQNVNQQPGIQQWVVTLAPSKSTMLDLGYQVQYPKDKQVGPL